MYSVQQYPPCLHCGCFDFEKSDGNRSCRKCGTIVEGHVEFEENIFTTCRNTTLIRSTPSSHKAVEECAIGETKPDLEWCLYDGFNTILVAQVNALIHQCGAPLEIKNSVFKLWTAYLSRLGVAFCQNSVSICAGSPEKNDEQINSYLESQEKNESSNEIPAWLSGFSLCDASSAPGSSTDSETGDYSSSNTQLASIDLQLPFISVETKKRKRKRKMGYKTNLKDLSDEELIGREHFKKTNQLRSSMRNELKTISLIDHPENDSYSNFSISTTDDEDYNNLSMTSKSSSRLAYLQANVEDCFLENRSISHSLRSQKTDDFVGPRTVYSDPEYLTLHKLLCFLNGALLINGIQINDFDIIRWARQGYIPLHGAHQLLPKSTKLGDHGVKILGGPSRTSGRVGPSLLSLRYNTARLLLMLGISELPRPPVHVVARKIIQDLQLPVGLVNVVRKLDKLVGAKRQKWNLRKIGRLVDSGTKYVGALVLIALKMALGLDGHTENKISDFASHANTSLQLKASSRFTMRKDVYAHLTERDRHSPQEMKTLFVWKEWVRFIEYRRIVLENLHVPSSIRAKKVYQIDPELMLRYAKKEGHLRCKQSNKSKICISHLKRQQHAIQICEYLSKSFPSNSNPTPSEKTTFHPCLFPHHGLVDQLLDCHPEQFSLLRQTFPESSLKFALRPKNLARHLHRIGYDLNVCQGPAYAEVNLLAPDSDSSETMKPRRKKYSVGFFSRRAKLERNIKPSLRTSTKNTKQLLLYQPSWAYWTGGVRVLTKLNTLDWKILSHQLPPTFRWTLKLVADSLGEKPHDLYIELRRVEITLQRWIQSVHSLVPTKEMNRKLRTARKIVL